MYAVDQVKRGFIELALTVQCLTLSKMVGCCLNSLLMEFLYKLRLRFYYFS